MPSRTSCLLVLAAALSASAATPVELHGALKTSGSQIVGSRDGAPVQVAGPSLYWSVWGGQNYYNRAAIDWVVKDWKATVVRAAMAVDVNQTRDKGYLQGAAAQVQLVKTVVDAAIANGIYVIVDWHDHDANLHVTQAKEFFEAMGQAYGSSPNVIWEIWNEPESKNGTGTNGKDTWTDIRAYADQVIPVIRKHSTNLIVVGTPNWSQDVDSASLNPLADTNVAYTLHFYAGTHKQSLRTKAEAAMRRNVALFVTEFGTTTSDGGQHASTGNGNVDNFKIYPAETTTWLDWCDKYKLSWANWSLSNKDEASAALLSSTGSTTGNWDVSALSESGRYIRDRLRRMDSLAQISAAVSPGFSAPASLEVRREGASLRFVAPEGSREATLRTLDGRILSRVGSPVGLVTLDAPVGTGILTVTGPNGSTSVRIAPF